MLTASSMAIKEYTDTTVVDDKNKGIIIDTMVINDLLKSKISYLETVNEDADVCAKQLGDIIKDVKLRNKPIRIAKAEVEGASGKQW